MFSLPSFALLLCLTVATASSGGKTQNSNTGSVTKPNPQAGQSFVVNNNCGLAKAEREMMAHIKAKVDYLAEQFSKGSACSSGWVSFQSSCFFVIDIPTLEWKDARRNCQKLGGDLAKITSAAENQFIYNLLNKQKKINSNGAWLGLRRKADTKFYWVDDTPLTGYAAWYTGEPNSLSEKCAHMYGPASVARGKWNDYACAWATNAPAVLCQKHSK